MTSSSQKLLYYLYADESHVSCPEWPWFCHLQKLPYPSFLFIPTLNNLSRKLKSLFTHLTSTNQSCQPLLPFSIAFTSISAGPDHHHLPHKCMCQPPTHFSYPLRVQAPPNTRPPTMTSKALYQLPPAGLASFISPCSLWSNCTGLLPFRPCSGKLKMAAHSLLTNPCPPNWNGV